MLNKDKINDALCDMYDIQNRSVVHGFDVLAKDGDGTDTTIEDCISNVIDILESLLLLKGSSRDDETEEFATQDSNVKYYIGDIEQRIGEHQPTTSIRFRTEGDPQAYLADIVKGFFGDEPNEDEPNSGVYWDETMEKVCYAGNFTEVSKDHFEALQGHLSNMTGYGFSEQEAA
tara:strand:+ start:2108 stop:2629 length:522 start_codon:yes stop_codon:yes gene_type:complete